MNTKISRLTIIIPTLNRSEYVQRTINFLEIYNLNILVLDGSDNPKDLKFNPIKTKVIRSKTNLFNRLKLSVQFIKTPYVKLLSDDEFLFNSTIEKFIDFLDSNPDYVSISGKTLRFIIKNSKIQFFDIYNNFQKHQLHSNNSIDRLSLHFENYTPTIFFSVIRSEIWKSIFENFNEIPLNIYALEEIHIETLTSLIGKCMTLEDLYLLRSDENSSIDIKQRNKKFFEWIPQEFTQNLEYSNYLEKISNLKNFNGKITSHSIHQIFLKYSQSAKKQVNLQNKFKFVHPYIKNIFPLRIRILVGILDKLYENFRSNRTSLDKYQIMELLNSKEIKKDFMRIEQSIKSFYNKNYQTVLPPSIDIIAPLTYEEELDNK